MTFKFRWEWFVIAGLVVFLVLQKGCADARNKQLAVTIDSLTLANQTLDSIKNKKDQTIYTQNVIATNMREQIKQLAQEKFDLKDKYERKVKDVQFFYQAKLRQKLPDSTLIRYTDTTLLVPMDCDDLKVFVRDSMIKVPKHIELDSSFKGVTFDADILKDGLRINYLEFLDSQYIRVDKMKRNVWQFLTFKPNKYQVKVLHTSPYMQVLGQNSIIYVPPKKANILLKAIGAGGLILLGHLL
jgi:hypothetical protein